jgi:putative SOS response-associated peptidase YedK
LCTNFTPTKNHDWLKSHFGVRLPDNYSDESFPGFLAPVVLQSHQTGRVACGLARFGLIPSWAKDEKISRHTYNTRSETVAVKPSYQNAWRKRQFCIAVADNFYEPNYETGKNVRWKIRTKSGEPFGVASIWEKWIDPKTNEVVASFSMMTVNADGHPVMQRFHKPGDEKRTPVILHPKDFFKWMGADENTAKKMMTWHEMPELDAEPSRLNL